MIRNIIYSNKFCVLMSVYGRDNPTLFIKAVDSVFANTICPGALVLVIDGPVPELLDSAINLLAKKYVGKIVLCPLKINLGLAAALNYGLTFCEYEWIFRADADDINLPHRFELMLDFIDKNPQIELIGGHIQEVDHLGKSISVKLVPLSNLDIINFLPHRNPFNHMTVGYKNSVIKEFGGYPSVHLKEDYALWIKLLGNGILCSNLNHILVNATTGDDIYKRRGGFKYARSEFKLQSMLCARGFKSRRNSILHGMARSLIFLAPTPIRKFFYQKFLRSNSVNN